MNKSILLLVAMFTSLVSIAQAPEGFNYQAVARDANGDLIKQQTIQVRTSLLSGTSGTSLEYQELHSVSTNERGLFHLIVGEGSAVSGTFSDLNWAEKAYFLQVELDLGSGYVNVGKMKLQSVPYAMFAAKSGNEKDTDEDTDSTNEIQTLSITDDKISLTNGGTITLPDGSSTNEIQTIQISGGTITLTDGGSVKLADSSASNELQVLSLSGDTIFLSQGGYVVIPTQDFKVEEGVGIAVNGDTVRARNDQTIWNANRLQGYSVSATQPLKDQFLQYNGSNWIPSTLTATTPWKKNGNNIYFDEYNVGIGTDDPGFKLHIRDSIFGTGNGSIMTQNYLHGGTDGGYINYALRSVVEGHGGGDNTAGAFYSIGDVTTNGIARGIVSYALGDGATNYGVHAITGEDGSAQNYGVVGFSNGLGTFNMGVYAQASRSHTNTNYGVYAVADSASTTYAGYFSGNVTYTGTLAAASDVKLKKNITGIGSALDVVNKLEPKSYYFKSDGDAEHLHLPKNKQFGFLAQDLEKVLPNLVHEQVQPVALGSAEQVNYKAVDYMSLIPVLTQAIKDQQQQIELLQQELKEVKEQLND